MNEFLQQFLIEARELAEQAADDLLALEQAPADRAALDSAFRQFHTLKGAAGIVEFAAMGRAIHAAEDLLAAARAGDHPVSSDLIGGCLACLDQIGRWLDVIETLDDLPVDADRAADDLVARFAAPTATASAAAPADATPQELPAWIERMRAEAPGAAGARVAVDYAPDDGCFFRGEDPLGLIAELPGLLALDIRPRQPWPPLDSLDPFSCNLAIRALSGGTAAAVADHLRLVRSQVQIHPLPALEAMANALPPPALAVLQAQIALVAGLGRDGLEGRLGSAGRVADNVLRHLGLKAQATEVAAAAAEGMAAGHPSAFVAVLEGILSPMAPSGTRQGAEPQAPAAARAPQAPVARALRVDVERIDSIVKLTGELTVAKNALGHAVRRAQEGIDPAELAHILKQQHALLDRLTADLQRSVMAIRVLALRHVFRRFPPLAREMAGSLGKAARLVIEGEETDADKSVVEALFEPLLHVLRNAVDHGIEAADERAAAGKPATATIQLRGYRQGESVIVEIADDGRGIDAGDVRRIAAARGLAAAEELAALSDEQAVDLVFTPGFSTAATVTGLSGRGVGMDAVRAAIGRLRGRVTIHSRRGAGTTIRFTMPFAVLVTRVMTVEAAGQVFGVPLDAVVETLHLRRDAIVPIGAAEAFVLRGRTIPLVGLARTLNLDSDGSRSEVAKTVVIDVNGELGALEVDRFGERLEVMLKPMEGLLAGMTGVAGTTLLGDGRVLIVLDLQELLQ